MASHAVAHRTHHRHYFTYRSHRRAKKRIPILVVLGLAPTVAFAAEGFALPGDQGGAMEAAHRMTMRLTGYEWKGQGFSWEELVKGWSPIILGYAGHKLAGKVGLNRIIAKSGIPWIEL